MHGHELLINEISNNVDLSNKVLIEIGTTREISYGQDSSYTLLKFCNSNNIKFITVDMDSENTENIKKRCLLDGMNINAITSKGEDFLLEYDGVIDFLYLDAFDFYHNEHSDKRKDKYRSILNTTINNEDCHKMHLDCCINSIDKISVGGYICIDDVFDEFEGKGKTAIPFLLENGFKIEKIETGCILLKKFK